MKAPLSRAQIAYTPLYVNQAAFRLVRSEYDIYVPANFDPDLQ